MIWKQVVLSRGGVIRSVNPFTEFFEKMYKEWQKRVRKARRQKGRKTNLKDVK